MTPLWRMTMAHLLDDLPFYTYLHTYLYPQPETNLTPSLLLPLLYQLAVVPVIITYRSFISLVDWHQESTESVPVSIYDSVCKEQGSNFELQKKKMLQDWVSQCELCVGNTH